MTVFFDNRQPLPLPADLEDRLVPAVESALGASGFFGDYEVSVSLVTAEEIRALNAQYRGRDEVTDVLSFPAELDFPLPVTPLGDIVLCPERAYAQAEDIGNTNTQELVYLTIHSVLHLLGYDHMDSGEKSEMRALEKKAFSEVNHGEEEKGDGF